MKKIRKQKQDLKKCKCNVSMNYYLINRESQKQRKWRSVVCSNSHHLFRKF